MAAFAAFLDTDRGPVKNALLGLFILIGAATCWFAYREQAKKERADR